MLAWKTHHWNVPCRSAEFLARPVKPRTGGIYQLTSFHLNKFQNRLIVGGKQVFGYCRNIVYLFQ